MLATLCALISYLYFSSVAGEGDVAPAYQLRELVPPSPFCGVHGLGIDPEDNLYAGSVVGQRLYRVNKISGAVEVEVGPPKGMADDMEFLPDGTVVWTSISQNAVRAKSPGGDVRDLANLVSVNSIAFRESDQRLFVAQVFGGDGLWEIDINGEKPPRSIIKNMGGLNGFDIGPDGMIYGPLWFKHQVVKINPDTGDLSVVADGFYTPAAANFDSQWNLYVLDTGTGEIIKIDINTGAKSVFYQLKTSLDNLAIDSQDNLYVSNMADNSIQAIDIDTKAIRSVVEPGLSCTTSLSVAHGGNGDVVYMADIFALRRINSKTGEITDIARSHAANTPIGYASGVFAGKSYFYVVSSGRLQQYDRDTDTLTKTFNQVRNPSYITELANGDLLVISQGGKQLSRYSGSNQEAVSVLNDNLGGISSVAQLDAVNAIAALTDADKLIRINLSTGDSTELPFSFTKPVDVAIRSPKQWLIRESQGRIIQLNPDNGDKLTILENFPSGRINPADGFRGNAMGLGSTGEIYLFSDINNAVYTITSK